MSHEPARFDGKTWEECRVYVAEEMARLANNIHALRGDIHAQRLHAEEQRDHDLEQRQVDRERIETDSRAHLVRLAVLETKMFLFGAVGGSIGGAIATIAIQMMMRGGK